MQEAIEKLSNTVISEPLTHVFVNAYFVYAVGYKYFSLSYKISIDYAMLTLFYICI